jgi:hypothetical protein
MQIITIDGTEYDADMLSENAKAQLISMQITDQKIANLQSELAIAYSGPTNSFKLSFFLLFTVGASPCGYPDNIQVCFGYW